MRSGRKTMMIFLAAIFVFTGKPMEIYAEKTTSEKIAEAEQEKAAAEGKLGETTGRLNDLKGSQQQLQGYLGELNDNLTEVSERLAELQEKLTEKEKEIEKKTLELAEAQKEEETQYGFMKTRIKIVYEKGEQSYFDLFMTTSDFGEFLNRAEYIQKVNEYDQKMLEHLIELKEETAQKKTDLEKEKEDLIALKNESAKEQAKVQSMVDDTSDNISKYSGQIARTQQEALAYEASINQKNSDITALKAQLEREKEIARRAAAMRRKDLSEINIDVSDRELLGALIQCESDGEPWEGKIAVGSVVLNRARSGVYPDTIVGVIYQSGQFAPVASGRLAMVLAQGANSTCLSAADEVLAGTNNIGTCLFFRTIIPGIEGTIIGRHIFY